LNVSSEANAGCAALGCRVKSGLAIAVLVTGPASSPHVLDRRQLDLCDPAVPESRQPYHAARGTLQTDTTKVKKLQKVILRMANHSVTELLKEYSKTGHRLQAVGLVVGSETDPATITNPHIRAHALEGQLFRTVLADAVQACGLPCSVTLERNVYKQAAVALKQSEAALKQAVAKLGHGVEGSWRADEKTACLAAWLALA
jgi:hypothetical protein